MNAISKAQRVRGVEEEQKRDKMHEKMKDHHHNYDSFRELLGYTLNHDHNGGSLGHTMEHNHIRGAKSTMLKFYLQHSMEQEGTITVQDLAKADSLLLKCIAASK